MQSHLFFARSFVAWQNYVRFEYTAAHRTKRQQQQQNKYIISKGQVVREGAYLEMIRTRKLNHFQNPIQFFVFQLLSNINFVSWVLKSVKVQCDI